LREAIDMSEGEDPLTLIDHQLIFIFVVLGSRREIFKAQLKAKVNKN